jgi:hypothetical protein
MAHLGTSDPRLAPWALFLCRSAAGAVPWAGAGLNHSRFLKASELGEGKRRARAAGRSRSATKKSSAPDLGTLREKMKITKLVGIPGYEMVKGSGDRQTSNVGGMKYLFELIGLFPFAEQDGGRSGSVDDAGFI